MRKNLKKVRRNDGILSPEELTAAIKEYKKRRAAKTDADDEEVLTEEEVTTDAEDEVAAEPEKVEDKIQYVKDRRDRRDEEGDPKSQKEAMGIIAHQDEDIDILFDIIDTLLAEKDFGKDSADEDIPETDKSEVKLTEDADDEVLEEEEEVAQDADDEELAEEEEVVTDADDEEIPEEELVEDADEEEIPEDELAEDADDEDLEDEEFATDCGSKRMNHDSVDRLVRQRVKLALIGKELHMDGLENMKLRVAKKKVIKAVKPGIRLDGKSDAYINAAFDMACDTVKARAKKTTKYQKRQMFNKKSRMDSKVGRDSAEAARARMIARQNNKEGK